MNCSNGEPPWRARDVRVGMRPPGLKPCCASQLVRGLPRGGSPLWGASIAGLRACSTGSLVATTSHRRMSLQGRQHAETNEIGLPQSRRPSRRSWQNGRAEMTSLGSGPTWLELHPSTPPTCAARSVARTGARQSQACGASRSQFGALRLRPSPSTPDVHVLCTTSLLMPSAETILTH